MQPTPPINTVDLLPTMDDMLFSLLRSLTPDEWQAQTIAKQWKVKDVVAHLLDGNIRNLSILRDGYFGESPVIQSYQDLVDFLNRLNADWVRAMKRVSPSMLIAMLELTGPPYYQFYKSLDPYAQSGFAVDWAGETASQNWFHIAREYTEKWLHPQQIRDAVNKPGLMVREYYHPLISTYLMALPHTYRHIDAPAGTTIAIIISTDIGDTWHVVRTADAWELVSTPQNPPASSVIIDPDTAWKLFSKSWRPADVLGRVTITGDTALGRQALEMVSVMA
jgi:uncharacterized protein (TIGR03083 family)